MGSAKRLRAEGVKCVYCGTGNALTAKKRYCITCYRNKIRPRVKCKRCNRLRVNFGLGYCNACYNYQHQGYRKEALDKYGYNCANEKCPITDVIDIPIRMFDVDHINGRTSDDSNDINNLQVLCVWCHALKSRKIYTDNLDKSAKEE